MDLTSLIPVFTGLLGSLATLGGVWITTRSSRASDEKRLALDEHREHVRLTREDEAERRIAIEAATTGQTENYDQIARLFVGELSNLRAQQNKDSNLVFEDFATWWDREWGTQGEMRMRRLIAVVTADRERLMLIQVVEGLSLHEEANSANFTEQGSYVDGVLILGFDLASTYARGQDADKDLRTRWSRFLVQQGKLRARRSDRMKGRILALVATGSQEVEEIIRSELGNTAVTDL